VPHAFLVLGSCANMIKGLSWMAGGSTRSVFNLSFVRDNNIAGMGPDRLLYHLVDCIAGFAVLSWLLRRPEGLLCRGL
jgi:hypothetical protein